MIIPSYWAEAFDYVTLRKRKVLLKRFGWSDESFENARVHARQRLEEAIAKATHEEEAIVRREKKVAYNGSDGLPIREEIVERRDRFVITRNSYGALCLNTPDVLIADIDILPKSSLQGMGFWILFSQILGLVLSLLLRSITALFIGVIVAALVAWLLRRLLAPKDKEPSVRAIERIRKGMEERPGWSARVYRTPAGLRVLVTHQLQSPTSATTEAFLKEIHTDPVYLRMCLRQNCFRARLTAKPWRCGIRTPIAPKQVWPIEERLHPIRDAWIEKYEQCCQSFAACRYLETIGSPVVHPDILTVLETHDSLCQSNTELPLA